MKLVKFAGAALAAASLLAGCSKEEAATPAAPGAPAAQASPAVTIEAIRSGAQGFTVGSPMSARTVYVFFDAQCPHCSALWYVGSPGTELEFAL